jgi:SET family sugar efflux transporter-like MFS transporter
MPLAGATLMLGIAMSFTAPYLSLFGVEQTGMTPLQLGLFMTLIAASGVVASAWAGKWSDRHGHHRALLLAALIAASLGFLLLCFVRNYLALLVIGVAFLGAGGSAMSLVFSFGRAALPVHDEAERSFALATLRTVLSMAWVFGPSVGALVLAGAGFYGLFLFAAACFAACGAIVWRMRESPAGDPHNTPAHYAGDPASSLEVTTVTEPAEPPPPSPPHAPGTQRQIWRSVVALTLIGLAANATMIVLPLYVVHGLKGTRLDVSIMLGLGAFLEIPMMLALGARGSTLNKLNWLAAGIQCIRRGRDVVSGHDVYARSDSAVARRGDGIVLQRFAGWVDSVGGVVGCAGRRSWVSRDVSRLRMPRARGADSVRRSAVEAHCAAGAGCVGGLAASCPVTAGTLALPAIVLQRIRR